MMKLIRYFVIIIIATGMAFSYSGCEEIGVSALEKPESTDVTIDTMFSTAVYAERVLWYSYRSLRSGITRNGPSHNIGQQLQADITDLSHHFMTWGGVVEFHYSGALSPSNIGDAGNWLRPIATMPYADFHDRGIFTFRAIRNCYLFLDNVQRVPDMSQEMKTRLSAEARMIIAYNMTELFRNYGGLPWLNKVYAPDDDFTNPRMTVEATVDSIVALMDKAIPDLPWAISEAEMSNWAGRFTQAGAMALKTRLLLFAASPLFNSNEPYLNGLAATSNMTWYGNYQASRYQRAADAAKELIDKIEQQGGYELEMPASNDVLGYREAFRTAYFRRQSREVLISIRDGYTGPARWGGHMYDTNLNYGGGTGTNEYMRMFPMADGTPITDPASGWNESVDPLGSEGKGAARRYNRDPRLYETMQCVDDDWGGEVIENWKNQVGSAWAKHTLGPRRTNTSGSTVIRKFIPGFTSGIPVIGHHFPYMRLPEIYLSYAEAMNELGQATEAYTYINKVRNRVGLKNIELVGSWDQESLREQILRERACELGFEQVRWFDIVRHKISSALSEPLHNVWITKNSNGTYSYTYPEITYNRRATWANFDPKWFLLPFPLDEIQKGYGLVQNPGW
jgi:starch-binding outer membrane protein, SusD/RagB family